MKAGPMKVSEKSLELNVGAELLQLLRFRLALTARFTWAEGLRSGSAFQNAVKGPRGMNECVLMEAEGDMVARVHGDVVQKGVHTNLVI